MPVTVHNTAIIPGPTTVEVIARLATVTSARTAFAVLTSAQPGAHYRFTAEGSAVYLLFGQAAADIGAIAVDAVAGATRPGVFIPPNDYVDLFIDQRNRFLLITKSSL